jgi:plastocyanin
MKREWLARVKRTEIRSAAACVGETMRRTQTTLRIALLPILLACALGITASLAHGDDPPSTASFKTVDVADMYQRTSGSGTATSANIVTGGTVTFSNSSSEMHSVDFIPPAGGGVSCQQTAGGTSPSSVRFPDSPQDGTWAGVCTFTKAGTYSFACDVHPHMTGTVVVTDAGAPPVMTTAPTPTTTTPVTTTPTGGTPTTPATTTPTQTPTTSTSTPTPTPAAGDTPSSAQTPVATKHALAVKISVAQLGPRVRGTISGAKSSARVRVALTALRRALGLSGKAATPVGIGSLSSRTTGSGTLTFAVSLNGKARAALAKRGRLSIAVHVTAPSAAGVTTAKVFTVVVRPLKG